MSDLVQKLVGALEGMLSRYVGLVESGDAGNWNAETEPEVIEARAALSAAKDGGWVAVPGAVYEDGGVSLIRRGTEDERCRTRGAVRLYAPLPNPPKGDV